MSDIARKRKYMYFPRRQKSVDYGLSDEADGNHMKLQRLKSIDENDSTDLLERSATHVDTTIDKMWGCQGSPSNQIKLAAIYDDEAEIIRILSSMKEKEKSELPSCYEIVFSYQFVCVFILLYICLPPSLLSFVVY